MNEQLDNILFWVTFVGVAAFIVNSIYATIVLRHLKSKEFKPPDLMLTSVLTTLAVMFVALAITAQLNKHNVLPLQQTNTKLIELHQPAGVIYEPNPITKKIDTIEIYTKRK